MLHLWLSYIFTQFRKTRDSWLLKGRPRFWDLHAQTSTWATPQSSITILHKSVLMANWPARVISVRNMYWPDTAINGSSVCCDRMETPVEDTSSWWWLLSLSPIDLVKKTYLNINSCWNQREPLIHQPLNSYPAFGQPFHMKENRIIKDHNG